MSQGSEEEDLHPIIEDSDEDAHQTDCQPPDAPKIVSFIVTFLLKFQIASDNAIVTLLRFFKHLLLVIGKSFGVEGLQQNIGIPQIVSVSNQNCPKAFQRIRCMSNLPHAL